MATLTHIIVVLKQLGSGAPYTHFEKWMTAMTMMVAVPARPFTKINAPELKGLYTFLDKK